MNIKCLPRIRGVPTSFYKLNMMFSTNQGTPQDYSSLHQIKAVAHITFWELPEATKSDKIMAMIKYYFWPYYRTIWEGKQTRIGKRS